MVSKDRDITPDPITKDPLFEHYLEHGEGRAMLHWDMERLKEHYDKQVESTALAEKEVKLLRERVEADYQQLCTELAELRALGIVPFAEFPHHIIEGI